MRRTSSRASGDAAFPALGVSWVEEAKLSGDSVNDSFGTLLDLDGTVALIAAQGDNGQAPDAGTAYVFERAGGGWVRTTKLFASDPDLLDRFGTAAALGGGTLVCGAVGDDQVASNAGAAYVFDSPSVGPLTYCTAATSALGCTPAIAVSGLASVSRPDGFELSATQVNGGVSGQFFFGTGGRQATPWGNGTSLLCVVPPVQRLGLLQASGMPSTCDGVFLQDLNQLWCHGCPSGQLNPGVGAVVQAQLWYRDPLNTSAQKTALSDAVEFTVLP